MSEGFLPNAAERPLAGRWHSPRSAEPSLAAELELAVEVELGVFDLLVEREIRERLTAADVAMRLHRLRHRSARWLDDPHQASDVDRLAKFGYGLVAIWLRLVAEFDQRLAGMAIDIEEIAADTVARVINQTGPEPALDREERRGVFLTRCADELSAAYRSWRLRTGRLDAPDLEMLTEPPSTDECPSDRLKFIVSGHKPAAATALRLWGHSEAYINEVISMTLVALGLPPNAIDWAALDGAPNTWGSMAATPPEWTVDNYPWIDVRDRADRLRKGVFTIGIEILPYELSGVILHADGTKLGAARSGMASMDLNTVVTQIASLGRHLADTSLGLELRDPRLCLGIALGGPVEPDTGTVLHYANNPHDHGQQPPPYLWHDVSLADRVQGATGCVTVVENDANAYAVYEQTFGVGQETGSFVFMLIRHGIGAAAVIDHRLVQAPMEFGHIVVRPDYRRCDCGTIGCIESIAGRRAIPAIVAEKTGATGSFDYEWAVSLANSTGPRANLALEAFADAGAALAMGIATVQTLLGSPHFVIYGPEDLVVENSGRAAWAFMTNVRRFTEYTFPPLRGCELTARPLDLEHGAYGAALIALERHFLVSVEPVASPDRPP